MDVSLDDETFDLALMGRCPGLDCSGPSGHREATTPRAVMFVTFLRTALHNRMTITASRHSGMFLAGIQKRFPDSGLRRKFAGSTYPFKTT